MLLIVLFLVILFVAVENKIEVVVLKKSLFLFGVVAVAVLKKLPFLSGVAAVGRITVVAVLVCCSLAFPR